MNRPDPLIILIDALVHRYALSPGQAGGMLCEAAGRKGQTLYEMIVSLDLFGGEPRYKKR